MSPADVYVHIGAFKTGTSYLQDRLVAARAELAASGVLCPGARGWTEQVRGIDHLLGRTDASGQSPPQAHWDDLVATIRGWDGAAAVLSFEFLSLARATQARRLVADLAPADVHVVLTARDLVRVVPAMWQEVLQGGQSWTWPQYCATVASPWGHRVPPGRGFWRAQDLVRIVATWSRAVPVERIHLVTVPPAGAEPEELWRRFASAIGVDPAVGADHRGTAAGVARTNTSLDPAAAELMRRVNLAVEGRMDRGGYDRVLKHFVAKQVLAARTGGDRVALDAEQVAWAQRHGASLAAELERIGVHVVGDLRDLVGTPVAARAAAPLAADVLDVAVDVIAALAERLATTRRRAPEPAGADTRPAPRYLAGSRLPSRLLRSAYERLRRP